MNYNIWGVGTGGPEGPGPPGFGPWLDKQNRSCPI